MSQWFCPLLYRCQHVYTSQHTQYLREVLCDKNEAVVVNKITVNVLSEGGINTLC